MKFQVNQILTTKYGDIWVERVISSISKTEFRYYFDIKTSNITSLPIEYVDEHYYEKEEARRLFPEDFI